MYKRVAQLDLRYQSVLATASLVDSAAAASSCFSSDFSSVSSCFCSAGGCFGCMAKRR